MDAHTQKVIERRIEWTFCLNNIALINYIHVARLLPWKSIGCMVKTESRYKITSRYACRDEH